MAESLPLETKEYFFACTRREGFWLLQRRTRCQMLELLVPLLDCIRFEFGVPTKKAPKVSIHFVHQVTLFHIC